jgi:hypothetical protein
MISRASLPIGRISVIFHASIPADDPERIARILAEIWKTHYFPFVFPDSFVVISGNPWGSNIEVCKRGDEQVPAPAEIGLRRNGAPSPFSEVHLLIGTELSFDEILALGRREGWIARICDRASFRLVELWIENRFLVEVTSGAEIERYRSFYSNPDNWREAIRHVPMPMPQFGYAPAWLDGPAD